MRNLARDNWKTFLSIVLSGELNTVEEKSMLEKFLPQNEVERVLREVSGLTNSNVQNSHSLNSHSNMGWQRAVSSPIASSVFFTAVPELNSSQTEVKKLPEHGKKIEPVDRSEFSTLKDELQGLQKKFEQSGVGETMLLQSSSSGKNPDTVDLISLYSAVKQTINMIEITQESARNTANELAEMRAKVNQLDRNQRQKYTCVIS